MVAPGRPLRDGLDRILRAKRGGLVVVGDGPDVLSICSGGFLLDSEFSPQRLSELAKMDGAIILAQDASRIARANVHLMPDASIPTTETGTRHRTAERVARSIDVPVLSVSAAMSVIAVYRNDLKHTVQPTGWLHDRTDQALATMQRFRSRFDVALGQPVDPRGRGHRVGGRRGPRHPGGRDGAAHRRGGRRLPGRAGRGRPPGGPAVGRAGRRGGPGPRPGGPRLLRDDPRGGRRPARLRGVGRRAAGQPVVGRTAQPEPGGGDPAAAGVASTTPNRASSPAATGCSTTCPDCPRPSSSGSSTGSSTSSTSCGPRWPSSSRSRGSVRPGPRRSRRAWPAWPRPASSSATSRRPARGRHGPRREPHPGPGRIVCSPQQTGCRSPAPVPHRNARRNGVRHR